MNIPEEAKVAARENTEKEKKAFFDVANKKLNGERAVGFFCRDLKCNGEDFIFDGKHIKVLPVKKRKKENGRVTEKRTGFYAAFDVNQIELNSNVKLKVPKNKAGLFIGTGGWQTGKWVRKLGLEGINVVEL